MPLNEINHSYIFNRLSLFEQRLKDHQDHNLKLIETLQNKLEDISKKIQQELMFKLNNLFKGDLISEDLR